MNQDKWSKKEKTIARSAFDKAYEKECIQIIEKLKKKSLKLSGPEDIWDLHDCDEFMFETIAVVKRQLPGIPFGCALRSTAMSHAENLFVDESLNVWVVDIKRHGSELKPASSAFYFVVMI